MWSPQLLLEMTNLKANDFFHLVRGLCWKFCDIRTQCLEQSVEVQMTFAQLLIILFKVLWHPLTSGYFLKVMQFSQKILSKYLSKTMGLSLLLQNQKIFAYNIEDYMPFWNIVSTCKLFSASQNNQEVLFLTTSICFFNNTVWLKEVWRVPFYLSIIGRAGFNLVLLTNQYALEVFNAYWCPLILLLFYVMVSNVI